MSFDNGIWGPYNFIQDLRKEWLDNPNPKYNPTKSQKSKINAETNGEVKRDEQSIIC